MNGYEFSVLCQALEERQKQMSPRSCSQGTHSSWGWRGRGDRHRAKGHPHGKGMVGGRGEVLGEHRRGSNDFLEGLVGSFISSHMRGAPFAKEIPETRLLLDLQIWGPGDNLDDCLSSVSKPNVYPIRARTQYKVD